MTGTVVVAVVLLAGVTIVHHTFPCPISDLKLAQGINNQNCLHVAYRYCISSCTVDACSPCKGRVGRGVVMNVRYPIGIVLKSGMVVHR